MSKIYNCIECGYADLDNTNFRNYVKCNKLGIFVDPHSNACYRAIERPAGYSSGCYITTVVCDVLGYGDDCEWLKTLRDFRDNYMKHNIGCLPLLMEYDMIGPVISNCIGKSSKKLEIANKVFSNYIAPAVLSIKDQDYEQAIKIYMTMTGYLENYFGINPINIDVNKFDYKTINLNNLGKARVRF